ncbi:FecR family protein [Pedobacter steynii]|uniref:Ferric-dicitrate binding protein FerR, regulates iron transport through sigma-19 n=1 Tax=Pedobacter steynii TaxID=430522 RepID=A0A1D7QPB4_9SPHI|nr:FecR family protein [Pedobacter steynii]AOM80530.1 hypothetical protein BFS30_27260 [Pedobacter steynii]
MEPDQFKKLLARYIDGAANEEEQKLIEAWYHSYDKEDEAEPFSSAVEEEQVRQEMKSAIQAHRNPPLIKKISLRQFYRYAAVLAIALSAFFLGKPFLKKSAKPGLAQDFKLVETGAGAYKKVILEDSTIIHMNPGTRLRIPLSFAKSAERTVYLDQGLAFFEVTKDPQHPFTVYSGQVRTLVLGTKFSLNRQIAALTEVSVSEGKVRVSHGEDRLDDLIPGKRLRYNSENKQWKVGDFATREHQTWFQNVINLNHASFDELAKIIRINYGVKIRSGNKQTAGYVYNLQIRSSRSLTETLKIICSVHQNKYRRIKNEIVIY